MKPSERKIYSSAACSRKMMPDLGPSERRLFIEMNR
jgi:hypothetical protein